MHFVSYNREKTAEYAKKWYNSRNSTYYNFDGIGGDCTNFASQCLYAGAGVMNYTKDVGWYYNSINDRAAGWSDSGYLRQFLLNNTEYGPMGRQAGLDELEIGDLIFLNDSYVYYHTPVVVGFSDDGVPLVAAHSQDTYRTNLNDYEFYSVSFVHIIGVNAP